MGKKVEALQAYDKVLQLNSNYIDAYNNKGVLLLEMGKFDEAIDTFSQAIKLNPQHEASYYNRACCYALSGKVEQALEDLKISIKLNPRNIAFAKKCSDFDIMRKNHEFQQLIK